VIFSLSPQLQGDDMKLFFAKLWLISAIVTVLPFLDLMSAHAQDCASVPTPNFTVASPPANAGAAAGFSGIWTGTWTVPSSAIKARDRFNVSYCTKFHISVKDAQHATVMLCSAAQPAVNLPRYCVPYEAEINGTEANFKTRSNFTYTLALMSGSSVHAKFTSPIGNTYETDLMK